MADENAAHSSAIQRLWQRTGALLPGLVIVVGIIASLVLWMGLTAQHARSLQPILQARADSYAELLDERLDSTRSSLEGAAQWWGALQGTPQPAWSNDARSILQRSPALTEIQWIDRNLNVRWHSTRIGDDWQAAETQTLHSLHATRLSEAARLSHSVATIITDANHPDGAHVAIFIPLTRNGEFDGFVRGTLDIHRVVEQTYADLRLLSHMRVLNGDTIIHEVGARPKTSHAQFAATSVIEGADYRLHAQLTPNEDFFTANESQHPLALALVVLFAAVMIALLMHQFAGLLRKDTELRSVKKAESSHIAHLESIYSVVPIGLGMLDLDLRYTYVNERLSRISDHTIAEHIGKSPTDVDAKLGERLLPFLRYVLESESPLESVEIVEAPANKNDSPRSWVCSFHVAYSAEGKVTGVILATLDITSLKEAERENQDLSKKLFLTQKTEALGRLTGGIAHDFNNMLGVILGSLEFVKDKTADDPEITMLVNRIELAAEHSADLIRQLLAFARQQPLVPRNVHVDESMENLLPLLQRSISQNITISVDTVPDLWVARVDESQLGSAVLNLVINARDAMPKGGTINIELSNAELDDNYSFGEVEVIPGEYVLIAVSDTGTGMTPDTVTRAFEPFFTTKESGKGSGLGLSMVFGFVKQSKGHIKIYSEVGVGTAIKIYLPRADGEIPQLKPVGERMVRGDEVILVVEDDTLMRDTAVRQLRSLGYTVLEANGGDAALRILDENPAIELLFTDVVMPGGLNGPELARAAFAKRPDLKVMFVSGYTDNALIDRGWIREGVELLQKPYRRVDLAAKVRKALLSGQPRQKPRESQ